jgi:hypothetical protein
MAKRMRTQAAIEAERAADRAKLIASLSERELAAWMTALANELNDPRLDWRLTLNHRTIIGEIRAALNNRRAAA